MAKSIPICHASTASQLDLTNKDLPPTEHGLPTTRDFNQTASIFNIILPSFINFLSNLCGTDLVIQFILISFRYGHCLARTRLGPILLPSAPAVYWDKVTGSLTGCLLCGWSILLESSKKRGEMALYVAPRALATVLPVPKSASIREGRQIGEKGLESIAFAVSLAILMTASKHGGKGSVRGFIGETLKRLMDL
jgi:hypothetical protein